MSIFSKSKASEPILDLTVNNPSVSKLVTTETRVSEVSELAQARKVVDDFNHELKESASRQNAALKRVSSLHNLISKMELDLKTLRRLEVENKSLNRGVTDLESKLAQKSSWASELDSKYTDLDRRHTETREALDLARASLAASKDETTEQEAKIVEQDRLLRNLTARAESTEDQNSHIQQTVDKLRDALDMQSSELAQRNRENIELANNLDELTKKYENKSKHGDATLVELKNLRLDFNELKTRHVELNGQLENTQYDLRTQKNVFDETIKRREEENLSLKTRIDQLDTQVRIKENMASHLDQEFITLRNELINERDRCTALEQRLQKKSEELDRSGSALVKSKIEYEELNGKFAATLEDFETMRRINQRQREKLERYASIGGVAVGQAMLNMDVHTIDKDAPISIPEDSENVTVLKTANKKKKK